MQQGSVGLLVVTAPVSKWSHKLNWAEVFSKVRKLLYVYLSPGIAIQDSAGSHKDLLKTIHSSPFFRNFVKYMYTEVSQNTSFRTRTVHLYFPYFYITVTV